MVIIQKNTQCRECFQEYRRGGLVARHKERCLRLRALWDEDRVLYTPLDNERIEQDIQDELLAEFGPARDFEPRLQDLILGDHNTWSPPPQDNTGIRTERWAEEAQVKVDHWTRLASGEVNETLLNFANREVRGKRPRRTSARVTP